LGDCDDAISEEGSVDSEEDEGGGHLIHDEEEEAYVITTKYDMVEKQKKNYRLCENTRA
jgi:hypothetical protein